MKTLALSLLLLLVVPTATFAQATSARVPTAQASTAQAPTAQASTVAAVPFHTRVLITYLSSAIDPVTGLLITEGVSSSKGTFGTATGVIHLELDLATLAFTGTRDAVTPNGSTLSIVFSGQFLDAVHSVGTFELIAGTGLYAGMKLSGTFDGSEWDDGVGNTSWSTGTAVF